MTRYGLLERSRSNQHTRLSYPPKIRLSPGGKGQGARGKGQEARGKGQGARGKGKGERGGERGKGKGERGGERKERRKRGRTGM